MKRLLGRCIARTHRQNEHQAKRQLHMQPDIHTVVNTLEHLCICIMQIIASLIAMFFMLVHAVVMMLH